LYILTEMLGYFLLGPRQLLYIAGRRRVLLLGRVLGMELWPLPRKFWDFFTWNGSFWCKVGCILTEILGNLLLGPQQLQVYYTAGGWGGFDRTSRIPLATGLDRAT